MHPVIPAHPKFRVSAGSSHTPGPALDIAVVEHLCSMPQLLPMLPCHQTLLLGTTTPGLRSAAGSVPLPPVALCVSVAVLTERIRDMTDHIVAHKKDHVSKRCVGKAPALDLFSVCLMQPTRHSFRQPSTTTLISTHTAQPAHSITMPIVFCYSFSWALQQSQQHSHRQASSAAPKHALKGLQPTVMPVSLLQGLARHAQPAPQAAVIPETGQLPPVRLCHTQAGPQGHVCQAGQS